MGTAPNLTGSLSRINVDQLRGLADNHGRVHGYSVFHHDKTGSLYGFVGLAKNCTNANQDETMVLYTSLSDDASRELYTREAGEFLAKFRYLGESESIEAVHQEFLKSELRAQEVPA